MPADQRGSSKPLSIVALIPARAGSKRVAGKNVRVLAGHPVLAYTIAAAQQSQIFDAVVISTDSDDYAAIGTYYGAEAPFTRPPEYASDLSPDIEWVTHALATLAAQGRTFDCFSILRPSNPFRTSATITRAWEQFRNQPAIHSLRAVEKCKQHPGKMWVLRGDVMLPLLPLSPAERPWHSMQYQALPVVYVQNASLEIAWCHVVEQSGTIAGTIVAPFFTEGFEGFDINQPEDWVLAEKVASQNSGSLPAIEREPYRSPAISSI